MKTKSADIKNIRFWMVFEPTQHSELEDICHETGFAGYANLARADVVAPRNRSAGVFEECVAIYTNEADAKNHAVKLLKCQEYHPAPDELRDAYLNESTSFHGDENE